MENSLQFLYIVFFVSIALYVIAGIITSGFVIPLQYKQAKVKNGLAKQRIQMLVKGILALVVIVASIIALTSRFFISSEEARRYLITAIIFTHAVGTLGKSVIDFIMYHQQFTEENIELHAKIEKAEKVIAQNKAKHILKS